MTLVLAMLLDALLGEPPWLWTRVPHPAVLMGRAIKFADKRFNQGPNRKHAGILTIGGLILLAGGIGIWITAVPGIWLDVIVAAILLAQRSLVDHVSAVATALRENLEAGRNAVAQIVSRDTKDMNQSAVTRSAIESGAENLSDGVIAPLFWLAIGGIPGLMIYKMANTADSMIGYRTPRYVDFGWAAARFDDLLNWLPARLTALLIWATDRQSSFWAIRTDARLHRSPNAGWPEAAVAHKHQIALAGPRSYDGAMIDYPYANAAGRLTLGPDDIDVTCQTLWQVWGTTLVIALIGASAGMIL